jgi:adenylate cyclase
MSEGRVERRLAAVVATDVVGYSRLMGEDEEGTLAALKAVRRDLGDPKIAEHRGRIVKTTGDGLLAEFSSVIDAVRCAVEIQRAMAERGGAIQFRIGINIGDIIIDDGDIFGDGVNVAARLEALAEAGGICVSAAVYDQVQGRLDCDFDDLGAIELKNIVRPVRVYRIRTPGSAPMPASAATPSAFDRVLGVPDKPSVAVLPFANMSDDAEQEYLADGISEDVISALSRYPSLFVISRNSCFTYKGRVVEIRQIGRELGVRYVLEGRLRKAGNRIRLTAQLVEAESGSHIWGERYDREIVDIFALQDEITEAVTIAIAPAIGASELRRAMRRPPGSLDAWSAYQRGLWHMGRYSVADNEAARSFFRQAIELDPTFSGGYIGLSFSQGQALFDLHASRLTASEVQKSVEKLARQAVDLDSADAEAHAVLSSALRLRGDLIGAVVEARCALDMSPNLEFAHTMLGMALIMSGQPEEGLISLETSFKLNPRARLAEPTYYVALGLYYLRRYEAAVDAATRAIVSFPDVPHPRRWLAAALGQLGRTEEARQALEQAIAVVPGSFDMYVRNRVPWMRPEDHAHMVDGLRKAGWEG